MRRLALALALIGCLTFVPSLRADDDGRMKSSDGKVQLLMPGTWGKMELNENSELEVGNAQLEEYLIVLNEVKEDLYGWNLDKHSRVTLANLISSLAFPKITGPKSMTINGYPAVQYEIRGASESTNVIYLHTTIEGPTLFSQVLAWTLPSKWDKARPTLDRVIGSYRELGAGK